MGAENRKVGAAALPAKCGAVDVQVEGLVDDVDSSVFEDDRAAIGQAGVDGVRVRIGVVWNRGRAVRRLRRGGGRYHQKEGGQCDDEQ
jgi:hypothetical protein